MATRPTSLDAQTVNTVDFQAVTAFVATRAATAATKTGLRPERSSAAPRALDAAISRRAAPAVMAESSVVGDDDDADDDDDVDDDIHCTRACAGASATRLMLRERRKETA